MRPRAHREAAGSTVDREGKEGAGLSAQTAEPLGEQGRERASHGCPGSAMGMEE